ncbi:dTDP-glucose 4,6-dehydratase [Nitratifractor sp.]|uniref:dTDP-glucose 4,6-dehydratase n=1 Tax=Nitratifractor sp. TaxID=2268144 RepID=UPI0025CD1DF4|nr:dTDP-glucose 4,6-dehydratase [Nitratifractor sp.]
MRVLITGGAGFIGSNFIDYILYRQTDWEIVNLDRLTYAGNLDNLKKVQNHPRYRFVKGDIRDRELVRDLFDRYDIRGVIHFAAESHVDNSIHNPAIFIETNVEGTFTLLDAAYRYWMSDPSQPKDGYEHCRFHHISTDEVYGSLDERGYFTEETPYAPNSPYSASKASSDMIVRSYHHTYGLNTVISNCSNNFGPRQHNEKLIPTIIRHAIRGETIPIYGDGKNIRDWLYVEDHCRAIEKIYRNGAAGETYLVGTRNELDNLEMAYRICTILDRIIPVKRNKDCRLLDVSTYKELIGFVKDRPGHDRRYAINPEKLEKRLKWIPHYTFDAALQKTVEWYVEKYRGTM